MCLLEDIKNGLNGSGILTEEEYEHFSWLMIESIEDVLDMK